MSRPRELWWQYMRRVIRDQPRKEQILRDLKGTERGGVRPTERAAVRSLGGRWRRNEYEAVVQAIAMTARLPDGQWRLRLIELMYFNRHRRYTLPGAAMECNVSERTAVRWHGEFIRLVASYMGLCD